MSNTYRRPHLVKTMGIVGLAGLFMPFTLNAEVVPNAEKDATRPNIVLFLSDDHGWRHSEPYGDTFVKTPNMTRLAQESMLFTHVFAGSPLCSPSRSVIATGCMPHRNGGHFFNMPIREGMRDIFSYMKEMGYRTAAFGKVHYYLTGSKPAPEVEHGDENEAVDFVLRHNGRRPFFLHVGCKPPHLPWEKNTQYDVERLPVPPNYVDTPETRLAMADYYTAVTKMDGILGSVMEAVKNRGWEEDTLFLYTTDQGAHLPFAKWCVSDGGLRVPFIVRWLGRVTPSSRSEAMVSLADLLPTFVEVAGGTPPDDIDGKSIVPILTGKETDHRQVVFGSHSGNRNGVSANHNECPMRTIRTKTHRYIVNLQPERLFNTKVRSTEYYRSWVKRAETDAVAKARVEAYEHRPAEELYDLTRDPWEMTNLADDEASGETVCALRRQMLDWCRTQGDKPGLRALTAIMEKE